MNNFPVRWALCLALVFVALAVVLGTVSPIDASSPENLVKNGDFENGTQSWRFYTNGKGRLLTEESFDGVPSGKFVGHVALEKEGSNVQLYQTNITLEPNQRYRLHFAAIEDGPYNGDPYMGVYLHKHGAPYTSYGLARKKVELEGGGSWKTFDLEFITSGFSTTVNDARLRFWFAPYDSNNSSYSIDHVVLEKISNGTPPPDPEPPDPEKPPPGPCTPDPRNILSNPGFEEGKKNWRFYTTGVGDFRIKYYKEPIYYPDTNPVQCQASAVVGTNGPTSNSQLYQRDISLLPKTRYRLVFWGGPDDDCEFRRIKVYLHKHGPPYTNYGLNGVELLLWWQYVAIDFTTTNFSEPVNDARLRLSLLNAWVPMEFDDFTLMPVSEFETADLAADRDVPYTDENMAWLISGYFIDDDDEGRFAGATVAHDLYLPMVR